MIRDIIIDWCGQRAFGLPNNVLSAQIYSLSVLVQNKRRMKCHNPPNSMHALISQKAYLHKLISRIKNPKFRTQTILELINYIQKNLVRDSSNRVL